MINDSMKTPAYPVIIDELWTSKQRQASPLHEISYRACFKPQLPRFFIDRFSQPGDTVYDPFTGRGTTIIEAAMAGRHVVSNDVNPLSRILTEPRLLPPEPGAVEERLEEIAFDGGESEDHDLAMFFHPRTFSEIIALRRHLAARRTARSEDEADRWIRMVATNRLTGHSPGFFSVYTLPPNQAASRERQAMINAKRNQQPEYRSVKKLIMKKTHRLLSAMEADERRSLRGIGRSAVFIEGDARSTPRIGTGTVQLTVTSPPFLDIVQYSADNWLRCWFNAIDDKAVGRAITMSRTLDAWRDVMRAVLRELYRVTRTGGFVAFEVGEIRKGTLRLDEAVLPLGQEAGFECQALYINQQQFSKTSNIWGVRNNDHGTNTNRIVLFAKPR